MKKTELLILMLFLTILTYGQRKIKKLEVKEDGFNINVSFQPLVKTINYNGLTITITPISTEKLNSLFLKESKLNGKFKYSYFNESRNSFFLKRIKKTKEKSNVEFLFEGAQWLLDNEKITQDEYEELLKKIFAYYYNTKTKENNTDQIIFWNPYYIGNSYLSTFKIDISNPTKSLLIFDKKLIIESGNSVLSPLSTKKINEELNRSNLMNIYKALTLERHNLPNVLYIPPDSKIEKIFAVLPINYNNKFLKISIPKVDKKLEWQIVRDEKHFNRIYSFYEFAIDWYYLDSNSDTGVNFNLIKCKTASAYIGKDDLYIGEDYLNKEFEIFTFSLYSNRLYYGRNKIKGANFVDIQRNRRKRISIKTQRIESLKKKVIQ